ncbi:LysR family transcriptional regulator [Aliidongia dinghuensis]|uniref:LysR family transcriptional regulator n=2 Tax=Aliidongia dinghuensis TaxID=1867774 RepID=A0A8J2YV71_9PROT|nr:LysR family transcriptional regulator [Aliidongia dinghuensis]
MSRGSLDDLSAFATVARTRSFTRAATELGLSNSMLSYTIKRLEKRLGMALLQRTSRSVAPTEAGEKLLLTLEPALDAIDETLSELDHDRDRVSGTLRITATRQAYEAVVRPMLGEFCATHPEATVEVIIDYGFRDIVSDRFDAGIRLGEKLQQDMIALRVGPELRMAVVASPDYLAQHPVPAVPQDLQAHRCINYRMVTANSIYSWEFEKDGRQLEVGLSGPLTFNEPDLMLQAAIDGLGVAYVLENEAAQHVDCGHLVRMLDDWTAPFPGFFLYYPSRHQVSPVFAAFLALLRARRGRSFAR